MPQPKRVFKCTPCTPCTLCQQPVYEARVLEALSDTPRSLTDIIAAIEDYTIDLDENNVISTLFTLELCGQAHQLPGKRFVRGEHA